MKKMILGLFLALSVLIAGCGLGEDEWVASDVYQPRYMGENATCYYIDDPNEAEALLADGLCQPTWRVAQAPPYWMARYAPYYDSPAYYEVYVRPDRRSLYQSKQVGWEKSNTSLIKSEQARATWINAKREPVPGSKIDYATSSFGSGRLRSTGFQAGGLRAPKGSGTGPPPRVKVVSSGGSSMANRGTGAGGTKISSSRSTFSSGSMRTSTGRR